MVEEAPTSADALRLAGLDWTVDKKNIQVCGGAKIENYKANVRSSDGAVLGVVTDRYKIVQNAEAFAFTDSLIDGEVHYETAGSLQGGKKYGFGLLIDNGDNKNRWVYLPISWPGYELDGYALAEMDSDLYIAPDWWIKI